MPRYWVIAPIESKPRELFEAVWQYDLANNLISIGWSELGDVSLMTAESLSRKVSATYPDKPPQTKALIANMLWSFYHEIAVGDVIVARRGRKILAGIGTVVRSGFFAPAKNPFLVPPGKTHNNFLEVEWQTQPCDKSFPEIVFPMHTLAKFSQEKYREIAEGSGLILEPPEEEGAAEDRYDMVLEKYLEEFIVSNFDAIFQGQLRIYADAEEDEGQQYDTNEIGRIDILATDPATKAFVVIELKKGRPSDQVIGQTLRYMGWVKQNLCTNGQTVRGLVICREPDPKLSYALEVTKDIDVRYYNVSFKLRESP